MAKSKVFNENYNQNISDIFYHSTTKWYNIGTDIFKWDNLPELILSKYIEKLLYNYGKAVFFYDKNIGYLILPCDIIGYNILNEPNKFIAHSEIASYTKELNSENAVLIKNNESLTPSIQYVNYVCEKISNTDTAREMNINALKIPYVFTGEKDSLTSFKIIYQKIVGNEPVLFTSKDFLDKMSVLDTKADNNISTFNALIDRYEKLLMDYFGLKYTDDKKERLIVDEANAKDAFIFSNRDSMYNSRSDAIDKINKMFGLDLEIKINNQHEYENDNEINQGDKEID